MDSLTAGTLAGVGSFQCEKCGYALAMEAADTLPGCPGCGHDRFVRASLFAPRIMAEPYEEPDRPADWLDEIRASVTVPGCYLAFESDEGELSLVSLQKDWTRVGRSLAADLRFDDPTVSRRHALVVRQADGYRVLDDRSLNGVFVNGSRVEWSALTDGDEITVGRYVLRFMTIAAVPSVHTA